MKLTPVRPPREGPSWRASAGARVPVGLQAPSMAWVLFGALVLAALLAVSATPPESRAFATRLAVLVIGLVAAWRVLGRAAAVTASSRERFEDALQTPSAPQFEIPGLRAVETDVRMATANAFGVELRLKPVLRELARWRLQRDFGIDLDRRPDAARQLLGERLWPFVAPSDRFPEFRAAGMPLADVDAGVDRLERL